MPTLPIGISYVEIAGGYAHTVARLSDGSVVAWGRNSSGQCNVPVPTGGLTYVEVTAGGYHNVARRSDGSIVTWGFSIYGQNNAPALPSGFSYADVEAGRYHNVARCTSSTVSGVATGYCTTSTTTSGCTPAISASGQPSASATTGFVLWCAQVEGNCSGMFFYGMGRATVPWSPGSTSTRCVTTPFQRMSILSSGGASGSCDGVLLTDWNTWRAAHPGAVGSPFTSGQALYAQAWFRDPPAPKGTNLSAGLTFTLCP